jgi:hypothetical protein
MNQVHQAYGSQRPQPNLGPALGAVEQIQENAVVNATQPHAAAAASGDIGLLPPTDDFPKNYSVSVDEIRLLLFENGIEKSKDTIQRYCREGRLDAVKLGLLRRYFATPLSVERLLEYLRTDAVEVDAAELDAAASTDMQVHKGADGTVEPELQLHAAAEPNKPTPEPDPHEAAPTRMQAHEAEYSDGMVDFLKGQINVKDEQIKVKDSQITAMLERDRETNFLIRELQTQLSNTFRLVADGREDAPRERQSYREQSDRSDGGYDSVEKPVGQTEVQ